MQDAIGRAAKLLRERGRAIALTGAGISVDSGIPDFRSAEGLWSRYDPMEYATIDAFERDPAKVWRMVRDLESLVTSAEPNPGHLALEELERQGLLEAVITQNIDGLHQRAGSRKVVELHGSADRLVCRCGLRLGASESPPGEVPRCPACDRVLKPDVIFFGEALPQGALRKAFEYAASCRVVLVVGTSATVSPASELPLLALRAGASLVELNLERTGLSQLCQLRVPGPSSVTLPAILEALGQT
ncbi:MAG: NAD-dependent deacylase [Polyangia bacterium]|jgi:NAD-dependent deacetylase|nr:NAD-dependent deacylase [Polyangia bacterium]